MQVPRREPVAEELQDYQRQLAEFTGEPGSKEGRQLRFEIAWRRERLALLDGPHPGRIEIRIGYLRINRAVLVAHPLELFLEYGNRIKEHSPYPNTFLIGYANEALGYLARPVDFEQKGFGWYAAVYAPRLCRHLQFDREAGDVFCNHIIALLHRIKQKEEQN
jgi:hypothetical protein